MILQSCSPSAKNYQCSAVITPSFRNILLVPWSPRSCIDIIATTSLRFLRERRTKLPVLEFSFTKYLEIFANLWASFSHLYFCVLFPNVSLLFKGWSCAGCRYEWAHRCLGVARALVYSTYNLFTKSAASGKSYGWLGNARQLLLLLHVVPTTSHQSSSKPKTQFSKWAVAETPFARASRGRCWKRMVNKSRRCANHNHIEHLVQTPLGEIVSENLETIAANIHSFHSRSKLWGAEAVWSRISLVNDVHDRGGIWRLSCMFTTCMTWIRGTDVSF